MDTETNSLIGTVSCVKIAISEVRLLIAKMGDLYAWDVAYSQNSVTQKRYSPEPLGHGEK